MLAGWVALAPLDRTSVTPLRLRSDATSSGGSVPMSRAVVTPWRASAVSVVLVSEMDVAVDQAGQQHPAAAVLRPGARRVSADAVAVDDDRRWLSQPLAVEYPHVGQRDLVHVVSTPGRPHSMAIVMSRNSVSPCWSIAGTGQTAETT